MEKIEPCSCLGWDIYLKWISFTCNRIEVINEMSVIQTQVKSVELHYRRRLSYCSLACLLLFMGVSLGVVHILEKLVFLSEGHLSLAYILCVILSALASFMFYRKRSKKIMGLRKTALLIESTYPELHESCISSIELVEEGQTRNVIERALIKRTEEKLDALNLKKDCLPNFLDLKNIFSILLTGLLLIGCVSQGGAFAKTRAYLSDLRQGSDTALLVTPGDVNIAQGSSISVEVEVKRGSSKLTLEIQDKSGTHLSEIQQVNGLYSKLIPAIYDDFSYRVISETHRSQIYKVRALQKPILLNFEIEITSPAYTAKASEVIEKPNRLSVLRGSELNFRLKTAETESAYLSLPEGKEAFKADGSDFTLTWQPTEDAELNLRLISPDGVSTIARRLRIKLIDDQSPVINVLEPKKDGPIHQSAELNFSAEVMDDFGLSSVELKLSDSEGLEETYRLYDKGVDLRVEVSELIKLHHLGLKEGDVLVAQFIAKDKAEPQANVTYSKLYFFEVRPNLDDFEQEQDGEGGEKNLTIAPEIIATRQLLRELYDLRARSKSLGDGKFTSDQDKAHDISSRLAALALDITGVQKEAGEMASIKMRADFAKASKMMTEASRAVTEGLLNVATKSAQAGLASLIRIDIELQKNSVKSRSQAPSESEPELDRGEKEEDRLSKMLEKLEDIEEQQRELNKDLAKEKTNRAKDQESLSKKTDELKKQAKSNEGKENLDQAQQKMQEAGQQMQQGQGEQAQQSAQEALDQLQQARERLEHAKKNFERRKLKALASAMGDLSRAEKALAEKSEELSKLERAERKSLSPQLKEDQNKLREKVNALLGGLTEAAQKLEEKQPEAADKINQLRQEISEKGALNAMKKAANALHYNLPGRAIKEQEKAADILYETSLQLKDAIDSMPVASLEELMRLRQELEDTSQNLIKSSLKADSKSSAKLAERVQDKLSNMGEELNNSELSFSLPEWLANQNFSQGGVRQHLQALQAATEILDAMIEQAGLEERISRSKRSGDAPDKYRQLVKDYLKQLGEQK